MGLSTMLDDPERYSYVIETADENAVVCYIEADVPLPPDAGIEGSVA